MIKTTIKASLLIVLSIFLSGCLGTYGTRIIENPKDTKSTWAGSFPFSGVAMDGYGWYYLVTHGAGMCSDRTTGVIVSFFPLISIPFDFTVDAVLSPVDLVYWSLGYHKNFINNQNENIDKSAQQGDAPETGSSE